MQWFPLAIEPHGLKAGTPAIPGSRLSDHGFPVVTDATAIQIQKGIVHGASKPAGRLVDDTVDRVFDGAHASLDKF